MNLSGWHSGGDDQSDGDLTPDKPGQAMTKFSWFSHNNENFVMDDPCVNFDWLAFIQD
jgi:hypothetical protein